jgi:hypothetical protein
MAGTLDRTGKGEKLDGQRGEADLEAGLGIVVADAAHWPGDMRGGWGNLVRSIPGWCGMHSLGILLRMVAWVVAIIYL